MSDDILKLFWTNVDWHRKNKQMSWRHLVGGNTSLAINYKLNVSLKKVDEIAKKLDIDDYAILFEELNE
ncbi:hypothetical protein [Vagococcus sp.]|uniref:hypothetical protein n=1 Tax=Vagococcus sp. TaxID=1933889 RepID=UPI003F9B1CCB